MIKKLKAVAWSLRNFGLILMLLAFGGGGYVFGPLIVQEAGYYLNPVPVQPSSKLGPSLKDVPNWQPPDPSYSLYIPKIRAKSVVVGNVNSANETAYLQALRRGVAEAAGLSHPGRVGTTYLFAHSTNSPLNYARYNAVFYLLDKLSPGDDVEVMYQGNLYRYQVSATKILSATDVTYLTPQNSEELLVLQTCYPPGTSWKRLVVVAKRT